MLLSRCPSKEDQLKPARLAAEETKLVVTTTSPATAQIYRLSDIMAGNVSLCIKEKG